MIQEESKRLESKCDEALSKLEGEAAQVEALKQALDDQNRQLKEEAVDLARREEQLSRCL